MIKIILSSLLLSLAISADNTYYLGAQYTLNLTGVNLTNTPITASLEYNNGSEFMLTPIEIIDVNTTMVTFESINLDGKITGLLIPDNEPGTIILMDSQKNVILSESVNIAQSILIIPSKDDSTLVQKLGNIYKLNNVSVSSMVYNEMKSPEFNGYLISVKGNEWFIESTLMVDDSSYKCNPINKHEYCHGPLSFTIPKNIVVGGPYILNVMLVDANVSYNDSNIYTINGREKLIDNKSFLDQQIITYDDNSIEIEFKDTLLTNESMEYYYYEKGDISIDISGLNEKFCIFTSLQNSNKDEYIAQCGSKNISNINVLDWRFINKKDLMYFNSNESSFSIKEGLYNVILYLDPNCSNIINDMYMFNITQEFIIDIDLLDVNNSDKIKPAIIIDNSENPNPTYAAGQTYGLSLDTSYEIGTMVEYYFETCNNKNCTQVNMTNNTISKTFTITKDNKLSITLPNELKLTQNNITSQIVFMVKLCDNISNITTTNELIIGGTTNDDSSNKLGAGAIVGIVCAGVLLCGLAAWWMCMRKSQGDGYRELNE